MKLTYLFIIAGILQVNAASYAQSKKVTLTFDQTTIQKVFDEIQSQTNLTFIYANEDLSGKEIISIFLQDKPLQTALIQMLSPLNLEYEISEPYVVIKRKKLPARVITGKVTDEKGEPLIGVTVLLKGTMRGTLTNPNGVYNLEIPDDVTKGYLQFSYTGYRIVEFPIEGEKVINVQMKVETSLLDEVVVVGYGTTKKMDLTGTVGSLESKEIMEFKSQTVDNAIAGKITGVHVQSAGGRPGQGGIVHIRGLSSLRGDNQPLYVVDGIPFVINPSADDGTFSAGLFGRSASLTGGANPLVSINPENIERIDVLKDASAAAIYGSRAANGVILITTKRGKTGQPATLSFNVSATVGNPIKTYDFLDAQEYKQFAQEQAQLTLDNSPFPEVQWPFRHPVENAVVNDPNFFGNANTNWTDEIINNNALWMQYNLRLSGGTKDLAYSLSASIADQEGIVINNDLKRYNVAGSLDGNVTKRLKVGGSFNYNHMTDNISGISGIGASRFSMDPVAFRPDLPVFDENGNYSKRFDPNFGALLNPLGDAGRTTTENVSKNVFGAFYAEWEFIDHLKFRSQVSLGLNDVTNSTFTPSFTRNALFQGRFRGLPGASRVNQLNDGFNSAFENTLSYSNTFSNDHRIDAVAGLSYNRNRDERSSIQYRGFPDDFILIDPGSANIAENNQSNYFEAVLNSVFGRINYVYNNKYLATFTMRSDASTKFGPGNQRGLFPSGALAWNIHHENFLEGNELISQLKLRASMGRTGSDNLPAFSFLPTFSANAGYNGNTGTLVGAVPNENIKWETTDQLDLGLEFGLFDNRLNAEIVYFEKNTSDIILLVPIVNETGTLLQNQNVADVSNKGWEFLVQGDIIRSQDFRWTSQFNISFVKNTVESLNGGSITLAGNSFVEEGEPFGLIKGFNVLRIAQTQEEVEALNASAAEAGAPGGRYQSSLQSPGDYIFEDIDGNGYIDPEDRQAVLGDINPDYYGGWTNNLSYKNFELGFNFQFVGGNQKSFDLYNKLVQVDVNQNFLQTHLDEVWSPENTGGSLARLRSPSYEGGRTNSRSVVDGNYIRLRYIGLSYQLPTTSWLEKSGIKNAKVSISANNLLTITNYPGLDPEDNTFLRSNNISDFAQFGDDGSGYPQARNYTFSLNITF